MKVECYLSKSCAAKTVLRENIHQALIEEAVGAEVIFYRISGSEAEDLGLIGSPSILINGKDIQPVNVQGFS